MLWKSQHLAADATQIWHCGGLGFDAGISRQRPQKGLWARRKTEVNFVLAAMSWVALTRGRALIATAVTLALLSLCLACTGFKAELENSINTKTENTGSTQAGPQADTAAPTQPGTPAGVPGGSTQIDISWSASTDNVDTVGQISYEICQAAASGGCGTFTATYTVAAGQINFSPTGLTALTTYFFVMRAKDSSGNYSAVTTEFSASTSAAGTVNNPTFSPVAGTYDGAQSITISTTTPGATICYATGATTPACNASAVCTVGTTYSTNIAMSTSDTLRAIACLNTYTASSAVSAAYLIDLAPPTTPLSPSIFSVTTNQVNMTWGSTTDDTSTAGQISKEICQSTITGGCDTFTATYTTSAGAGSYNVTGLNGYTTYFFRVRAKDSFGKTSASSAEFSGTTNFWKLENPTMTSAIYTAIAYGATGGNGTFVAVANSSNTAYLSTDMGATWSSSAALPQGIQNWSSVTYGSSKFVAVCNGCNTVAYSTNGISWTASSTMTAGNLNWSAIARGSTRFLALASGSNVGSYSTNGTSAWTNSTTGLTSLQWSAITTNGTAAFVAVATNNNTVATTTNSGTSWATTGLIPGGAMPWSSVAFGGTKYVAVANGSNTAAYATSPNAAWSLSSALPASTYTAVASNGTTFVAVGGGQSAISSDGGATWTALNAPGTTMTAIAFGNGKYVAITASDTRAVTSP
jgi:hypothetical protein